MYRHVTALVALALVAAAPPAGFDLSTRIDSVTHRPEYASARWGILVVDPATGATVFERNADQLFAPASVTKLFSCAAAWVGLGPDFRFETPVYARGRRYGGQLFGDLILVGSGDFALGGRTGADGRMAFADDDHIYSGPTKNTTGLTPTDPLAGLRDLAKQIKAAGITDVVGDVLIDNRLWDAARGSGSGPDQLVPVMVNDNIVDVVLRPADADGKLASFVLRPSTSVVQADVRVTTREKGPTRIVVRKVGPMKFAVTGDVSRSVKETVRTIFVDDPAAFARSLFIDALREAGVAVRASALRAPTADLPETESYAKLARVAVHKSPPFSEAVRVVLKVSHNLYASVQPILLATKGGGRTLEAGMKRQGEILAKLGLDLFAFSLQSGAGGGNGDRVSPRVTVNLLRAMFKREDWAAFEDTLPILGVDGTLADTVPKTSPARGKVKGKTGTYTDDNLLTGRSHLRAKSLAGVMTTRTGRTLLFCVFVNDVPLGPGVTPAREGRAIGRICEILQAWEK